MSAKFWESLRCEYFYDTCLDVLSDYFFSDGFVVKKGRTGSAIFLKDGTFVDFGYSVNHYPKYFIQIAVGFGVSAYDDGGAFMGFRRGGLCVMISRIVGFSARVSRMIVS